ncbi:MAG: DegV family protein [Anaerolineae bacterium]|nr:MAG: DegV family protein [Anaerolineae bacterium]
MSKIAFVTDSTAYIPQNLCEKYNITMLPQILIWGEETFRDGVDIQPDAFYQRLATAKVMPSSSQVSLANFQETFQRLLDEGYEVLTVLISQKLSGTVASATQARANFPDTAPIEIVDSHSTAMAMGFQILHTARAVQEKGLSLSEARLVVENSRQRTGIIFTPETLEFLHRGGRIGGATRFLGTALNIKPILDLQDGYIEPLERVRTRKRAKKRLVDIITERTAGKPAHIAVLHANAANEARELMEMTQSAVQVVESIISDVSPVIGTHVGPGTLAIAYMTD